MTHFLPLLFVGVSLIWGIHCLFSDGYLLGEVGNLLYHKFPKYITKPAFACPPCMSSLWGFMISVTVYGFDIPMCILYMICLCGLNFIIKELLYD